jgi:pimeloyl-ACP methyl ester carboxylesterase/DNA-binding CsgD family transcriptional regulator
MEAPLQYARSGDGVRIAYLTVGQGPPIVFASNIFGDAFFYRRLPLIQRGLTDGLAALGWQVICHDVRGMGSSDRDVADFGLEARVRDVEAVVDKLRLARFVLAGADIGAATAITFAARHPERVASLVLVSPWASGTRMFALPPLRIASAAMMSGESDWSVFTHVLASVATTFGAGELGRTVAKAMQDSTTPRALAHYYRTTEAIDLGSTLSNVTAETLVIHEQAFPFGSFELCKDVAAGIPNARLIVLQGPSLVGQVHDGYVETIDRFLRTARHERRAPIPGPESASTTVQSGVLTARELEILRRLARGATNKEIARDLDIAVPTVERHVVNIYAKIGARRRADATAYAVRLGLDRTND